MAVARRPGARPAQDPDAAAERFISGAAAPVAPPPEKEPPTAPVEGDGPRKPATIRFDPELLGRVDRVANRRGISRSAWVQYTLSKALDEEGI